MTKAITPTERISFWTAVIGLVTAIVSLILALGNRTLIAGQEIRLRDVEACRGMSITIGRPQTGDHVGASGGVIGTATINDACGWVSVFVETDSANGRVYRCTDIVQIETNGRWSAKALYDHVVVGEEARVEVRLTGDTDHWAVEQRSGKPPREGIRSNTITVRRTQ